MDFLPAKIVALLSVSLFACQADQTDDPSVKPNIVVILIDDLGWSDVGCYGHPVHQTPHIDRLARQGIRLTDAYAAAPICSPTRAALLTGKSPAQLHFEFVSKPDHSPHPENTLLRQPAYPRDLPLSEITIAEMIDSSYTTGFFGKWHLTQENDRYLGWGDTLGPLQQGFEYGTEERGSHPYAYSEEEKKSFGAYPEGIYPNDGLLDQATQFLVNQKEGSFLLNFSMYYVHTPVQTRCRWLYDKYRRLMPYETNSGKIHYAAFVETMDHHVGKLINTLDSLKLGDRTLVLLTSDNGGHPGYTDNAPLKGNKWNLYEGGIRVPMIARWPGKIKAGTESDMPVTSVDIFPTIAAATTPEMHIAAKKAAGLDLSPVLFGTGFGTDSALWQNRILTWHFPFYHPPINYEGTSPCSAIRRGRYKLVYFYEDDRSELYDLGSDLSESSDVSAQMPSLRDALHERLIDQLTRQKARFPLVTVGKTMGR